MNIQTKIASIIIFFLTWKTGFCQLSLENIFLNDKYAVNNADDIQFLHTKPHFAKFIRTDKENYIAFYNDQNAQTDKWYLSKESVSYNFRNLTLSNSDQYFLLGAACDPLYRYSLFCEYFYGDKSGKLIPLSTERQIYPAFSPDDKKIAFIKNNNLFYKNISNNTEIQISTDGVWNKIINGKSDWVYEEEFKLTRAYEWNKYSDKIAYLKFDESEVKEYTIPLYYDLQYPNYFTYKYPKVAEKNSKVSIWLYDIKTKKNKPITLPFSYEYLPRIYWNASGDEVIAMLLNRHQDTMQLVSYNIKTRKTRLLYAETDGAYVEIPSVLHFLTDNSFIISSEKDGFNHLYHYDNEGKLIKQLSSGNYEVKKVIDYDEKNETIYFQSNEGNEIETNIFALNYKTLKKEKLSEQKGSNNARFVSDFSYYLHNYSNAETPPQISIKKRNTSSSILIENNQTAIDSLKLNSKKEFIKIPCKDSSVLLNAYIIKPSNYDSARKYPLFVYTYGGPNSQEVLNKWHNNSDLFLYFLAEQGYFVACIDNRGTSGQGAGFKKSVFLQLGKFETEDQINAVKYLSSVYNIDKNRIGIYGWSFGGFLAATCLFEGNAVFKIGIAAAPVSNWTYYNTVFTERYLRTPKENPLFYHTFNPASMVKKLSGHLLLIHGTADDNVHFQHSLHLINALNNNNKSYQIYLNQDAGHGTNSKKMKYNLHHAILKYIREYL